MKYNLILIVAFAILLTLSSCSDKGPGCAPDRTEYFFIKPEEKAVLPYKGFDTLKIKHSSGAIHTFIAGPIDSGFNITARSTSPDCANNIFEYRQYYSINFVSSSTKNHITTFIENNSSYGSALCKMNFQNVDYFIGTSTFTLPPPRKGYYDYDSISINSISYKYVRKIYPNWEENTNNYVLYNREFGLLKVTLSNGETWERIP